MAGDEQTVFLPGARHFQSPLPSELLLSIWLRILCRAASGLHFVCLFHESLGVFLFPPSSQHGTKTNYPSKFDSRTLERSQRPSQQPIGRSKEKLEARPKPVLPPEDPVLIDLLSEGTPPYQAPPRPASPPATPPPASAEVRCPDATSLVADEGTSAPSPVASRLCLRRDPREGGLNK